MISSLDFVTSAIFGPYFFQHIAWQDLDDYINIERVYPELVSKALPCASVEMNDCTTSVTSCKDADDFCILSKKEGNRKEALKTRLYSIMPWFTLRHIIIQKVFTKSKVLVLAPSRTTYHCLPRPGDVATRSPCFGMGTRGELRRF